ncbi:MAG: 6-phospho-3-hexuloisomerase [Cyanobacteria bacterium J06638_38]
MEVKTENSLPNKTASASFQNTDFHGAINLVFNENLKVLEKVDFSSVAQLAQSILDCDRLFVAGEGRSGLAIQMAAMRLMHLGREVHVVGEVTAPSIEPGDLLITCSGSGSTHGVVDIAQAAQKIGVTIAAITTNENSPLGKLAKIVIQIDAASKQTNNRLRSKQFAGSLFEQSTLLLFDTLFYLLAHHLNKSDEALMARHTNLE